MDTEKSLIAWLNSNSLSHKCRSLLDLADLQLIYELLSQISPRHFSAANLVKEEEDNKVVTMVNYRTLFHNIEDYYLESLNTPVEVVCSELSIHDLAYSPTPSKFLPLMELVLSIAVQCKDKQTYITRICSLPEGAQSQLMVFIQRVLDKSNDANSDLERVIRAMRREKRQLRVDFDTLKNELISVYKRVEDIGRERSNSKSRKLELQEHHRRFSVRQTIDVESLLRFEFENQMNIKNEEIEQLKREFTKLENDSRLEIRRLEDELYSNKGKLEQIPELLLTFETYKKRIDELEQKKEELKEAKITIEEQSTKLEEYRDLDSTLAQLHQGLSVTKEQLKSEKDTVSLLQDTLADKEVLLQSLSKTEMLLREKNGILSTRISVLTKENEALRSEPGRGVDNPSLSTECLGGFEWNDKVNKLEKENAALRASSEEGAVVTMYSEMVNKVMAEKKNLEERCRTLEKEKAELISSGKSMEKSLSEEKRKSDGLTVSMHDLQQKWSMAESAYKGEIEAVQRRLADVRRAKDDLERYFNEVKAANDEKLERIKSLEYETTALAKIIKEKNEAATAVHENALPEVSENHLQTLKILELERHVSEKASEISSLTSSLSDRDQTIAMLKDYHEDWIHTFIQQNEESKNKLKSDFEAKIDTAQREIKELSGTVTDLKKTNESMVQEWRREERLFSMVIHSVGAELTHHQLKCHK